jgi:hypothetical protein
MAPLSSGDRERGERIKSTSGRLNKLAGQIGEYLVCAELGRRGLIATPFAGNVPTFDVLATDDSCRTVPIQIKASRSDNWPSQATRWMQIQLDHATGRQNYSGPTKLATPDLIWVCVAIAAPGSRDRFFVLTEADIQRVCIAGYTGWMESKEWKRPRNPASFDCRWSISNIQKFEDNWELIIRRLREAAPDSSLASLS